MANNLTTINKEGIEYLCKLINQTVSLPSDVISDLTLGTNQTFSSVRIDTLLKTLKTDCNDYTDKLVSNLSRLELKIVTNEADINKPNILYLYKPDGATSYNQYLVIEGNKVLLGTTDISMTNYYTITQADAKFCLITDYNSLKTAHETHKNDTDIHVTTSDKTKWNKVDNKVDKTDIIDNLTSTNTDKPLSAKQGKVLKGEVDKKANDNEVIKKTDITTTINSSSTDTAIPSAKAVYNAINTLDNNVYHVKQTLLFESGANGESDGSIIIGKEYTAKESILPHRMATVLTYWRECAFTKANWYNENWFYIDGHANDYNEEQNILFTYEIRILVKQSDTKIFKVLYSKRLAFNLNDNTFTSTDIKSGIALSKFV